MDEQGQMRLNRRCGNDWSAIADLVQPLGDVQEVAIEACCGSASLAEELRNRAGWSVQLAHPGYVNRMRQGPDKSDWTDGKLLADLVRVGYLPKVWLAPPEVRQLRDLVRYRQQLVDRRRTTKLRLRALLRNHRVRPPRGTRAWTNAWRYWLAQAEGLGDHGRWVMDRHLEDLTELDSQIKQAEARLVQATADDQRRVWGAQGWHGRVGEPSARRLGGRLPARAKGRVAQRAKASAHRIRARVVGATQQAMV